jgi:hypothetical protein
MSANGLPSLKYVVCMNLEVTQRPVNFNFRTENRLLAKYRCIGVANPSISRDHDKPLLKSMSLTVLNMVELTANKVHGFSTGPVVIFALRSISKRHVANVNGRKSFWKSAPAFRAVARGSLYRPPSLRSGAAAFTRFASEGWWAL